MDTAELTPTLSDAQRHRALALLERLTALSSSSGDPAGLRRFAAVLRDELTHRGWLADLEERPVSAVESLPLLRARHGSDRFPLLLIGHFDTVLDATTPVREPRRLHATGAIDMKGGIVALLAALDCLHDEGRALPDGLELVLVPDEEVAGPLSRAATVEAGARARALWVLEPGELLPDGGETVVAGRRGLVDWRLEARGVSAHSGLAFARGRSAVAAACRWADAAARLSSPPAGPTVNLARIVGGEREFVEALPRHADLLGSGRQINVVSDRAVVEGEFRFLRQEEGNRVADRLDELARVIAAETGVELELRTMSALPPVEPDRDRVRYVERARALAARRGWKLEVELDRGGVSFPNLLPAGSRIPVIDGLGPAGGGMHTRDEWIDLQSFERRVRLLADLLRAETDEPR